MIRLHATRNRKFTQPISALLIALSGPAAAADLPQPVRVAKARPGHVHPAICVTKNGVVLIAHYAEVEGNIFICRSTDGGKTWSDSSAVPDIGGCKPYPGALTTLGDGTILLTWNCWLDLSDKSKGRQPHFCTSRDDGKSWSAPQVVKLPDPAYRSALRHSIVEWAQDRWLLPIEDRTLVYQRESGQLSPLCERKSCSWPIVRTPKGTLLSGSGLRSTDSGKNWEQIRPFPRCGNYANDMVALTSGWIVATEASKGATTIRLVVSRDDGKTWDLDHALVLYDPGRRYGNGAPHLAELDRDTLGVVFWDDNREQVGGPSVFFVRVPLATLRPRH